jgi:hypothetical protein
MPILTTDAICDASLIKLLAELRLLLRLHGQNFPEVGLINLKVEADFLFQDGGCRHLAFG